MILTSGMVELFKMRKLIKKAEKLETNELTKMLTDLEKILNETFGKKAPKMPQSVVDFLVKYGPYLMIFGVVLTAIGIFQTIGLVNGLAPIGRWSGYNYGFGPGFWIMEILLLIPLVIEIMAISPLMKKEIKGWRLLFYASLISTVIGIFRLELVETLIAAVISWYILFQIKKEYK